MLICSKSDHDPKVHFFLLQCTNSLHFRRWSLLVTIVFELQKFITNSMKVPKIQKNLKLEANSIFLLMKIYWKLFWGVSFSKKSIRFSIVAWRAQYLITFLDSVEHFGVDGGGYYLHGVIFPFFVEEDT